MTSSVTFAKGFTADGVACGIKKNGNKDLAAVVCEKQAGAAGIFTQNIVKGHSLLLTQKNIKDGTARAVIINSGNANACLAQRGESDAQKFAALAASKFGCSPQDALPASTGVIGQPLPLHLIEKGIDSLKLSKDGGYAAAQAIMTTDTVPKQAQTSVMINGKEVRIGGMAKGSGMIHPDMATMISVITTDAVISSSSLKSALTEASAFSFNRISIDGDTSVCDEAVILASCMAGNEEIASGSPEYTAFLGALKQVCISLAKQLAADGEGATKLLTIKILGAGTDEDAHMIANAVAKSPLCKTAAYGNDANWGRLLTAAGYSGAVFDPYKVDIFIGSVQVCKDGGGLAFDEEAALKELKQKEVIYTLSFGDGDGCDTMYTCDFSHDYISINADYRT